MLMILLVSFFFLFHCNKGLIKNLNQPQAQHFLLVLGPHGSSLHEPATTVKSF